MRGPSGVALSAAIVTALVVVATVGIVAFTSHPTPSTAPAVGYVSEVVRIPVNGGNLSGPESNFSAGGIRFHLWPEYMFGNDWLGGAAVEPSGMELALLDTNTVSLAAPPGCCISNFTAPDGTFGATWLSGKAHSDTVLLRAALPQPDYAISTVTIPPGNATPDCQLGSCNVTFRGITFQITEAPPNPGGTVFDVVALGANGTTLLQTTLGGPLVDCGIHLPGATLPIMCEETVSNDLRVGVAWGEGQNVTLMVGSAGPWI